MIISIEIDTIIIICAVIGVKLLVQALIEIIKAYRD